MGLLWNCSYGICFQGFLKAMVHVQDKAPVEQADERADQPDLIPKEVDSAATEQTEDTSHEFAEASTSGKDHMPKYQDLKDIKDFASWENSQVSDSVIPCSVGLYNMLTSCVAALPTFQEK